MPETRNAALVQNVIAILESLDWHEIDPLDWRNRVQYRNDPCHEFLSLNSETRERVWSAIQRRLPEHLRENKETV